MTQIASILVDGPGSTWGDNPACSSAPIPPHYAWIGFRPDPWQCGQTPLVQSGQAVVASAVTTLAVPLQVGQTPAPAHVSHSSSLVPGTPAPVMLVSFPRLLFRPSLAWSRAQ